MAKGRTIGGAIAGGTLAAASVGVVEAVTVWVHGHAAGELPAIAWALVAYGSLGAIGGAAFGVLAGLVGTDGFALAFAAIGFPLAFAVGRFRIIRDVFLEQAPRGLVPIFVQLAALALVIGAGIGVWWALGGLTIHRRIVTRPIVVLGVVVVAALAWARGTAGHGATVAPPPQLGAGPPVAAPDIILITVDTLRADHLSCYGYAQGHTPHIDALASDGTRFANAFSQASWTRPSMATILTGLYPSSHGAVHKADRLAERVDTLAELLSKEGYYTAAFVDNVNIAPAFNFQQGFAEYHYLAPDFFFGADEPASELALYSGLRLVRERFLARRIDVRHYYQPAEVVTAEVERWAQRRPPERQFFLFVHYMDPHDPYFVHPFNGEGYARVANPNPPPEIAERYRQLYDGEIAYLDEQLGVLFDDLRAKGIYDRALIILTADHGEEFHEHGGWWHGTTLYDEQTHVPLIVKLPGTRAVTPVVEDLATSLDIVPTILAAARAPVPESLPGHALLVDGGAPPPRDAVFAEEDFEGNVLQAVRTPAWKLVTANTGNPRGLEPDELYDLTKDTGEHRNLSSAETTQCESLRAQLGRLQLVARAQRGVMEEGAVDRATSDRLRALGYVR